MIHLPAPNIRDSPTNNLRTYVLADMFGVRAGVVFNNFNTGGKGLQVGRIFVAELVKHFQNPEGPSTQ